MLKYVNTGVVFQEIPDEVTLSINISNCPCHCPGCHSQYLWDDIGCDLTPQTLGEMMGEYADAITCVCFMGGDSDPEYVGSLARYLHIAYPSIKVAWYSGRSHIPAVIEKSDFDYIKTGPYIEHLGGLKSKTTNQHLYMRVSGNDFVDITCRFWKP